MLRVHPIIAGPLAIFTAGLLAEGCRGDVPAPEPTCTAMAPIDIPLRRLTRIEYNHTVFDLFADASKPADAWLPDPIALGFDNNAASQVVTLQVAEQFMAAAEAVAETAVIKLDALLPCAPSKDGARPCATKLIDALAAKAYRRPLTDADRQRLLAVYDRGEQLSGFATGIRLMIEAVLQSPYFLYRVEMGTGGAPAPGLARLSDHEIAARLSYLLWATLPDQELRAAADAGKLSTKTQIRAQAERMLGDARARNGVANFTRQWASLDELKQTNRHPKLYPQFSKDLVPWIAQGTTLFVDHVTFSSAPGDFRELMTASYALANERTASLWGASGVSGDDYRQVPVSPAQRAGFITDVGWLTARSKYDQSDPVARGVFVLEHLLCKSMPDPPDDVQINVPPVDESMTTRERFAVHTSHAQCAGCHKLIDGIGFGFEHYDALGSWRDRENAKPIDASGEVLGTGALDGKFDGAVALAHKLADSDAAQRCFATQWFRYAYGRGETPQDVCTINELSSSWSASGSRIRDLLVTITQSEAFFHRNAIAKQECMP
jgi:hypothetical protein